MWANRTITHAADARRYGVEGLIGIHWRTFETSLSLKALARVALRQAPLANPALPAPGRGLRRSAAEGAPCTGPTSRGIPPPLGFPGWFVGTKGYQRVLFVMTEVPQE